MSANLNLINAIQEPWSRDILLYMADKKGDSYAVASGIMFKKYSIREGDTLPIGESIRIDGETATRFMDALWNCGIRPSIEADSIGEKQALVKHLEDMRQMAFKALKVEKP